MVVVGLSPHHVVFAQQCKPSERPASFALVVAEHHAFLPAAAVFIVFTLWWPVSARLHLKLYARLVIGGQNLKRWKVWKDDSNDWKALVEEQRALSAELVDLGTGLMLPGDPDWVDPDPGHDDVSAVRFRSAARPS